MLEKTLSLLGKPSMPPWDGKKVNYLGKTHIGMVRETNQDSWSINESLGIYLVADGMGGRAGGEVASSLAVSTITSFIEKEFQNLLQGDVQTRRELLAKAINAASLRIYERSLELPQYRGMGTTATLLWIPPPQESLAKQYNTAIVAQVGDSRCYLFRTGFLYQITDDHSLVNEQIKSGIIKQNDPMASQIRNVITRCVGYQEEEEVDTFVVPLYQGDKFLLCSDGITGKVKDFEIGDIFSNNSLENCPDVLIEMANSRGGEDNSTTVLVGVV